MAIYLGLGSNLGDRKENIEQAITYLQRRGFELGRISPLVETPAMLPGGAEPSWNKPFLNCVVTGVAPWTPKQGLQIVKEIEAELGRDLDQSVSKRWSPRTMDIDILIWHDQIVRSESLTIPHYGIAERPFVLTPLLHLQPDLVIPGQSKSVYEICQSVKPVPLWMGILNITPDSFSDGGKWDDDEVLRAQIETMMMHNVQIIDIGAESTRPNADPVSPEQEWRRLSPVLTLLDEVFENKRMRPAVSVDSRHWQTLEKALGRGVDIVNDVTGLDDPNILSLVKQSNCDVVMMHSMSIPVDPKIMMPVDQSAILQLQDWLNRKMDGWLGQGMDLNKVIIDPGIGFGKNPLQSLELLRECIEFRQSGLRILIGHSRKSFMNNFAIQSSDVSGTPVVFADRDLETLGISLGLCQKGVDIIRVHDPVMHIRAHRAWSHI